MKSRRVFFVAQLVRKVRDETKHCRYEVLTLGILAHRRSEDEQGVYNHLVHGGFGNETKHLSLQSAIKPQNHEQLRSSSLEI